jgi:thiamine kinase-like enzyme
LVGSIRSVERSPYSTVGFSGTKLERIKIELSDGECRSFIFKDIPSAQDFTAWRTGDVSGREARLLRERQLDRIWDIFDSPYLAYSIGDQHCGVLMEDLSDSLFPDVREPLQRSAEEKLLCAFAKLHAEFWEHPVLSQITWLGQELVYFNFLSPNVVSEERVKGRTSPLFEHVEAGWDHARTLVSNALWEFLNKPAAELHQIANGLPKTLLHGDSKVANFAIDANGKLNAFDWAMIATASPACEIGWYIAVNATRLTRSKEEIFRFYRNEFENHLGSNVSTTDWNRTEAAAILSAGMALLWSKALNCKKGLAGSQDEWTWWMDRIEKIRSEYFS